MPKIIIIRGPLGVGKTTIAKILAKKLPAQYLSLDKILEDNGLDSDNGISVENFLKANELIAEISKSTDQVYIIDGCFYYPGQIADLQNKFPGQIRIFSLQSDLATCISRDAGRDRAYGEEAAKFVHQVTSQVKAGEEIDNNSLSAEETANIIINKLK